jgi:hydroxymethylpyrimidine pyrophosphatase-like HAD family hydrolase
MIIAVDFDGTIVEHEYPKIGKPVPFAIDVLKRLQNEDHHIIILWTMREGELLQEAIDYCEKQGLTFYAHNKNYPEEEQDESIARKIAADIYIDDRNIGGLFDWGIIYRIIKSGSNRVDNLDMLENSSRNRNKNWLIRMGEAWDKVQEGRY